MRRATLSLGVLSTLALSACAVAPPQGPTVMALPSQGKTFGEFQQEDATCRAYANQQTGGASAAQAGTNAAVGSALLGTALGAGVGAALGSVGGAVGAGAAIGGATGLLAGSAIGANNAYASAGSVQQQYDISYTQCMYSKGNTVKSAPAAYAAYPYGGTYAVPYAYAAPAPYYPYAPWYGSSVFIGTGWGWGGGWGWHGGHRHW
ncbi:MAG TPA: glycine zipper family protein [Acetobacteraceae bacterium]|nr:glycine zipper family protein [Acetobacteraceae bacterium]